MLQNNKIMKVGAYLGLASMLWANVTLAMIPQPGVLVIHGTQSLEISGHPPMLPVVEDVSTVGYEDFDVTVHLSDMFLAHSTSVFQSEKDKIHEWHLDTNIPYIDGQNARIDYIGLRCLPLFIMQFLADKVHPSKLPGAKEFFEKVIVRNQQTLSSDTQEIPDLDCLYYRAVSGQQHLFLRLSSATRQEAELFRKRSNGQTLFAESGEIRLLSGGSMTLDHVRAEGDNITCEAKETIFNRASQMKAKWIIRLIADRQRNETVMQKWVREDRGRHHFTHQEGVERVDECSFVAQEVIQEGREVENIGIFVEADRFEDRGTHTVNMPARITLYNYAWEEREGMFSSASTSVRRTDDVLVPTRYHVNYYRSASSEEGSSVKFGYTLINAGSQIEVIKDEKEDVVVDERHTIEIHEEKSGFSICGGVSVPDPTALLQRLQRTYRSRNMIGLSTTAISAVAKGIRVYEDYRATRELLTKEGAWSFMDTLSLMQTLSHYVNGPSIQFGSRSFDMRQETVIGRGNTFLAPRQIFHNSRLSSFAGRYSGEDIDIRTKTFITFDIPQRVSTEVSVHESGISMDLLSFAIAMMNPGVSSALNAGIGASSINIRCERTRSGQVIHEPTVIEAGHHLNIEAENGILTQAQIKAGIVHAIFSKDVVLRTLAKERWEQKRGGGIGFSIGGLISFTELSKKLEEVVSSSTVSLIDSGSFEKIIDDFAMMVGEDEFYLKVGGILRTESGFIGHATHDKEREHIEAGHREDVRVEEVHESWDDGFELSIPDVIKVGEAIAPLMKEIGHSIFEEAIAEGATKEEAQQIVEQEIEEVKEDLIKFQEKAKEVKKKAEEAKKEQVTHITARTEADEIQDTVIDLLLAQPSAEEYSILDRQISDCFNESVCKMVDVSPREQVMAFEPKNKGEDAIKSATLLRYKLEDFVAKHPERARWCSKAFVGAMLALQGVEYIVAGLAAGPFGVAGKFAMQEGMAFAIDKTVDESSNQSARLMTQCEALQKEFAGTIKFCTYVGLCAGSVKASKKLVSSLTKSTVERSIYKGGAYDSLKIIDRPHNIERHHIPADSVSATSRGKGMAIQMEAEDHAKTSSFRNSLAARRYRAMIRQKIQQGDIRGAVATEIMDVKSVTSRKYNQAMQEMLRYGKKEGMIVEKK